MQMQMQMQMRRISVRTITRKITTGGRSEPPTPYVPHPHATSSPRMETNFHFFHLFLDSCPSTGLQLGGPGKCHDYSTPGAGAGYVCLRPSIYPPIHPSIHPQVQ